MTNLNKARLGVTFIIVLLMLLCLQGCTVYGEVGVGKNDRFFEMSGQEAEWLGSDTAAAYLGVRAERDLNDRVRGFCTYAHYSQWSRGWPVDNRGEDWLDHVGCGVSVRVFGDK